MSIRIKDAVVVITGASSGIGRATALEFARKGATVALAARREDALQEVAQECKQVGGDALVVPTDVTDEDAVRALAKGVIDTYGRIDVWVNNAAVSLFARFEEAPSEVYRKVIETNLFGYIYGARAVLPYFREQGRGVLINVDSVVADAPQPYTSAYVISKYGIRGLADSLRMELNLDDAANIHVCTAMPASIDTPLFQQAANYTGRKPKALDPTHSAQTVAKGIVRLAEKPQREVVLGKTGLLMSLQAKFMPGMYERTGAKQVDSGHFIDQPAPPTTGNLFEPMPEHTGISGGWSQSAEMPIRQALVAGGALLAGWLWLRFRNGQKRRQTQQQTEAHTAQRRKQGTRWIIGKVGSSLRSAMPI